MRKLFTLLICSLLIGCRSKSDKPLHTDVVFLKFCELLSEKKISLDSTDESGLLFLTYQQIKYEIDLDNARRDFELSGDFGQLEKLLETIIAPDKNLSFEDVEFNILPYLQPADLEIPEGLKADLTPESSIVIIINQNGNQIFIQKEMLKSWGKTDAEIHQLAMNNLDRLTEKTTIGTIEMEGKSLGFFDTNFNLKTSYLISTTLKNKVQKQFGWPVYAVFPAKDFCYIFSEANLEFFSSHLGSIINKEYYHSPHPVSREIIKISDKGIEAIGQYKAPFP